MKRTTVDIIVPVFRDLATTRRCIESVLNSNGCTPFELVIIWDCGPEVAVLDYLRSKTSDERVKLIENRYNVGFVASVNRGMQQHPERDVILLNSDTEVANDWVDRLLHCANSDQRIGTVTPFSNNAEICSFPELCEDNALPYALPVPEIDRVFGEYVDADSIDLPTGIGCCMLVRRDAIEKAGYFDEILFRRGYGEENDFCRKLALAGYRNVLCTNVFVYHEGGISFGEERGHLIEDAMKILDRKYPDYHRLVHEHIIRDPSRPHRLQAALALLAASGKPVVLSITHNLGGGTDTYADKLCELLDQQMHLVTLKPREHYLLEMSLPGNSLRLWFDLRYQREQLVHFCRQAGIARIHVQHIMGLEASILTLLREFGLCYDITIHDYFFVNGNPTLTDENGAYCADSDIRDEVCARRYPIPRDMSPTDWRRQSASILAGADRIILASAFSRDLLGSYFPSERTIHAWHPDYEMEQPYPDTALRPAVESEPLRIVVLGALSIEKGADILETTAIKSRQAGLPIEFHLVGYAYRPLHRAVISHGPYGDDDLDDILSRLKAHLCWFPCLWPETYSFTLSACFRNSLPVIAPDFGAFAERINGRPYSRLVPPILSADGWLQVLENFIGDLYDETGGGIVATSVTQSETISGRHEDFYRTEYLGPATGGRISGSTIDIEMSRQHAYHRGRANPESGWRERILLSLYQLRSSPLLTPLASLIPIEWQRRLKRKLSHRPIHELANRTGQAGTE